MRQTNYIYVLHEQNLQITIIHGVALLKSLITTNQEHRNWFICFRAINEAELDRLCEEREVLSRKVEGLESELKIQQQVLKDFV